MPRFVIYLLVAVALLGGGYLALPQKPASDGVHYSLIDVNGNPVTEKSFGSKYTLVSFGYTYCPDVCPTTLLDMGQVMELLGQQGQSLVPVFITIDPERDSPQVLKDYLSAHHPTITGLTGKAEDIRAVIRSFNVYAKKDASDKDNSESYLMSHSALFYVVGPNGQGPVKRFSFGDPPEKMANALRRLF